MAPGKQKDIVIAEDSLTQAEVMKYSLEQMGYRVRHGMDGIEAMELIRKSMPELVISDVIMPRMNGYELCSAIKSDPDLSAIRVLLLTTLTEPEDILIGLECGADSYLMKPYEEHLLKSKAEALLSDRLPGAERPVNAYELYYEGRKYNLKTTRARILEMMVTTYEAAREKNQKLQLAQQRLKELRSSLEKTVEERTRDLRELIRERRSLESSIKQSEMKYRGLVENALLGVVSASESGVIRYVNPSLLKMLEYSSPDALTGKSIGMLFESEGDWRAILEALKSADELHDLEAKLVTGKAGTRWAMLNISLGGKALSAMVLDISARKEMEQKDQEVREALRVARDKAEESDRQKSIFLNNMSHEIKTPLNAIIGLSGLLAEAGPDEDRKAGYLNYIRQSSHHLSSVIHNILELAKLEASKIQLYERPGAVNGMVDEILKEVIRRKGWFEGRFPEIKAYKDRSSDDPHITADTDRLKQVFHYLLDNAIRHTPSGTVTFGYEMGKGEMFFFVRDNGTGMDPSVRECAFDRFQKAETPGSLKSRGMGLGLTISRQLIEMMRGEIWIVQGSKKGTEIRFTTPCKVVLEDKGTGEKTEKKVADSLRGSRILVAEDNTMNYMLLKAFLEPKGIELTWARDGVEAIEQCSGDHIYDMVLMDILMPRVDGYTAATEIRKLRPELPIIAVTACAHSGEENCSRESDFSDFLTKPVSEVQLTESLKRIYRYDPERSK
jgi:PAS domain S-box-containing protein